VQLFVDRAAANGSGFELSDAETPIVSNVCRRPDGIALALELVAGRVGSALSEPNHRLAKSFCRRLICEPPVAHDWLAPTRIFSDLNETYLELRRSAANAGPSLHIIATELANLQSRPPQHSCLPPNVFM
jgi:hypothetical protein